MNGIVNVPGLSDLELDAAVAKLNNDLQPKVLTAVSGNLAAFDAKGCTVDSGYKPGGTPVALAAAAAPGSAKTLSLSDHVHPFPSQLATARNFSITGGATAAAVAFNGTADVALNVTAVDAAKLTGITTVEHGGTGNATGQAPTATKLAAAREISLVGDTTGKFTFDGSGNVTVKTQRRGCVVGQTNNTANGSTWFKFASFTTESASNDFGITFIVDRIYMGEAQGVGILTAHVRTGAGGAWHTGEMQWLMMGPKIDNNKFVLAHTPAGTGTAGTFELWVNCSQGWERYHFDVMIEGDIGSKANNNMWTLYNTLAEAGEAAPTDGYEQVVSEIVEMQNNVYTATKWANPRKLTVKGTSTGVLSNIDGSADMTLTLQRRGCLVGQTNSTAGTATWYKFASYTSKTGAQDYAITFLVDKILGGSATCIGILNAHIRTTTGGSAESGQLKWLIVADGVTLSDFVIAHKAAEGDAGGIYELWVNCRLGWGRYHFTVIEEGDGTQRHPELWTLYDNPAEKGVETPTAGYTQIVSTADTIRNTAVSANSVVVGKLTNDRDLNTLKDLTAATIWYAEGNNTVANSPAAGSSFGLWLVRVGGGVVGQLCFVSRDGNASEVYWRKTISDSEWSPWAKIYPPDAISSHKIKLDCDVTGEGTFDGKGDLTIQTKRRGCLSGINKNTADIGTKTWVKFATYTTTTGYEDPSITFFVDKVFKGGSQTVGILTAHLRTDNTGKIGTHELKWFLCGAGVDPSKFVLAHSTTNDPSTVELWLNVADNEGWVVYHFTVLFEGTRTQQSDPKKIWTLIDGLQTEGAEAPTAGYTQVPSVIINMLNPVPKLSAGRTFSLSGDATGTSAAFDGSANATIPVTLASVGKAGTYGKNANLKPAFAGTIVVPTVTTDAKGRVTAAADQTITLPAAPTTVTGNAGSATKLATARTISLTGDVTGTSAAFDGSANASIPATLAAVGKAGTYGTNSNLKPAFAGTFVVPSITTDAKGRVTAASNQTITLPAAPATGLKQSVAGQTSDTAGTTNMWFKVASITNTATNIDQYLTLLVDKVYSGASKAIGILTVHVRTSGTADTATGKAGNWGSGEAVWLVVGQGVNLADFVLAHNGTTGPGIVELWVKAGSWVQYHFTVLQSGNREAFNMAWTMVDNKAASGAAAPTSGYIQTPSVANNIRNQPAGDIVLSGTPRNIIYNGGDGNRNVVTFYRGDANGTGMVINTGGRTIIGGGEAASALRTALGAGTAKDTAEELHLANDGQVQIHTNCQTITNRKTTTFAADGFMVPPNNCGVRTYFSVTYLQSLNGMASVSSNSPAGAYQPFIRGNSTNGHFVVYVYNNTLCVGYGKNGRTDNGMDQYMTIMAENGNMTVPGAVYAQKFTGAGCKVLTLTLSTGSWSSSLTLSVTATGVVASETSQLVLVMPNSASRKAYMDSGVYCSAQAANSLTFTCTKKPTANLTVYAILWAL